MKFLFVLASVLMLGSAVPYQDRELQTRWIDFKTTHRKSYADESVEQYRYQVWLDELKFVDAHNARYEAGEVSYFMAQNHMSDLTLAEKISRTSGYKHVNMTNGKLYQPDAVDELPLSFDWRNKDAVTPPKAQGGCSACWAFSSVAAMECMYARSSGKLIELSEQELVDCVPRTSCAYGGNTLSVFHFLSKHGLQARSDYPYVEKQNRCQLDQSKVVIESLVDFYRSPMGDDFALHHLVAKAGVVSTAIQTSRAFYVYKGGVFVENSCDPLMTNHAVAIVGYGTENGTDYYIVKNSWGKIWGEEGFARVGRNQKDNYCGLTIMPTLPMM